MTCFFKLDLIFRSYYKKSNQTEQITYYNYIDFYHDN